MSVSSSPPEHLRKPHDNDTVWLLRRIWNRVNRQNEHFMGVIVGREGSGKSYTAMKIASLVDPTFTAERVIFDVVDLLKRLRDGRHEPGQFYILDEAGVQLGRRTWHERGQVLTNQALQLIRSHNLGLIFTLPRLGELDSQAQGRLQAFYELTEKENGEYVRGKWKWLDPDRTDTTGKVYKPFPRRRVDGTLHRLTSVAFSPPPAELTRPYEEAKSEFQERFYEKTLNELEDDEEEDSGPTPKEIANTIIENDQLSDYVSTHGGNGMEFVNKGLVRADHELSHAEAEQVKALLERERNSGGTEQGDPAADNST